jgi:thymidylate kinase
VSTEIQTLGKAERLVLIVMEGPPGAGKSSLATLLPNAVRVCESSTPSPASCLAEFTRTHSDCFDPIERFLLYTARTAIKARAASDLLAKGTSVVVVDRFETSLQVLGTVTLGLAPELVTSLVSPYITRALRPDLTIFLDCSYTAYRERVGRRGSSPLDITEYQRQRDGFRRCFEQMDTHSAWIDTTNLTLAELGQVLRNRVPVHT